MANEGNVEVIPARPYEDYESLKKWLSSRTDTRKNNYNEIITHHTKLTTGAALIEVEALGDVALAIAQIGRTEVTVLLDGDADNASTNGKIYTFVYVSRDGVSHTAIGTGTATLNGTPVAFVPAVTDCYAAVSFTASAADTNVEVYAKVAAGITLATITKTTTAATEAQLSGVGAIYLRTSTNHNDGDGALLYLEYLSGVGTIKHGHGTINTTDGTTEVRFFEADDEGDGTTAATLITLKDFYRIRWCHTNKTPTSNTGEFLITDADCGNVDGSSNDIWGIMVEGDLQMAFTRYCCPIGYTAWLATWHIHGAQKVVGATTDTFDFEIVYTDRIWATPRQMIHVFAGHEEEEIPIPLAEMADISFFIADLGGPQTITVDLIIVEAIN